MPPPTISLIITGASRGFGRAIALAFGEYLEQRVGDSGAMLLVARSALQETMRLAEKKEMQNDRLQVSCLEADLADAATINHTIDRILSFWQNPEEGTRYIFINNVGSLGYIGPVHAYPSLTSLQEAINLNVTHALWMAVRLARWAAEHPTNATTTLVNISSLLAVQPLPTLATYAAGKAARDVFHTAWAMEGQKSLRILNYAPGPLRTDMTQTLQTAPGVHASARPKTLLEPLDSARVLMRLLLEQDNYENGAHVDYYDCL